MTTPVHPPTTVLHVGFHKTGTTTLQSQLFPALPHTAVLGPRNPGFGEFLSPARRLCWDDDGEVDSAMDELRKQFAAARDASDTLIVSFEDFSQRHQGGRTARRLQGLLPEARVLICVRDQRTLLFSRYVSWIHKGGSSGFAAFLNGVDPAWLEFDAVVSSYQAQFGAEQVKVLPYELLASDPDRFLGDVVDFVAPGQPVPVRGTALEPDNRSLAPPTRALVRVLNRLLPDGDQAGVRLASEVRVPRFGHRLERWDRRIFPRMRRSAGRRDAAIADRYATRYAEGNARLARMTGLSLATYGYPLPAGAMVSRA